MKSNKFFSCLSCLWLVFSLSGCAGVNFTFTGVNLDPKIKTFSVTTFYNEAPNGPSNMGIDFSERLKEYFQRNTSLKLVDRGGDLEFEGTVNGFRVSPLAPGANDREQAEQQRLTVNVKVNFINNYDDTQSFNQAFSFYEDFPAEQNVQDVEADLLDVIFEAIILDIFNKSVANW
ncbi:LPS assembly lipoprotein LptE [Algivirga pacifica]|uniref:LptE family protein n=1 Tax=Algivirga pacifica TaxID=1162670 RepID=A0ABP9CY01_9BACT